MDRSIQQGIKIGGYELLGYIGAGSLGVVYRAYQSSIGREVAVKIISSSYAALPEFIRRFEREIQSIARLEHLHIVPIYDYWMEEESAYLVMRWLQGGNLGDALRDRVFDLQSASILLDQLAGGLDTAHNQQIFHGNLKPSNILLDEERNAYIADFGFASNLRSQKDITESRDWHTHPDSRLGELVPNLNHYLAPEQLLSHEISHLSDIYSLGIILYEVLSGHPPFSLPPNGQLAIREHKELPIIDTLDPELAEAVNKVLRKATSKKPTDRFQDALEMASAFRKETEQGKNERGTKLIESLTLREHEIMNLIIKGHTNKQIAEILFLEVSTIKWYINKIYKKLGVRSRVQAIIRSRELDLIISAGMDEFQSGESSHTPIEHVTQLNPYKGLRAFESADRQYFFGRETFVNHLLSKLSLPASRSESGTLVNNRFLTIFGPSGSGKSSLVKAGLIPALWSGGVPGSENWFIVTTVPGSKPLDGLKTSLMSIASNKKVDILMHLSNGRQGLTRIANQILPDDDSELMVVIDQFEELFTLVESESTRSQYLDLIHGAVTHPGSRVRVVITMRADFYDRPLHYTEFGSLVQANHETLLPLAVEELERAITKPAQKAGVAFEPGLVAKIIEEVNHQPGALPFMQFALTELFEQRKGTILTSSDYQDMGRITGSLARRAEAIFLEQNASGKEMIRQMFLRLIDVRDLKGIETYKIPIMVETRRRVKRAELLSAASEPERLDEIIDMYADYRLLTLDHDPANRQPTVELAHEALIRAWKRLQEWLEESAADLTMYRQLIQMAQEWIESGRDESFLLRGARLTHFQSWSAGTHFLITHNEKIYLEKSIYAREERAKIERTRQQEKAELEKHASRRLRQLVTGLVMGLVITIGLTIAAVSYARRAEKQNKLYFARELLAAATSALEKDPELSIMLALESMDATDQVDSMVLPELENLLHQAIQADRTEITIPMVGFLAFSPDSKSLAIGSSTGELKLWDSKTGEELFQLDGHTSLISGLAFGPEGHFLASSSFDGQVKIWDLTNRKLVTLITGHLGQVNDVDFSPDGRELVTVDSDAVSIWDVSGLYEIGSEEPLPNKISEPLYSRPLPDGANSLDYSPDGKRIAVLGFGFGIQIWDSNLEKQVLEISEVSEYASGIVFSPNSEYMAGSSGDTGVTLWNASSGAKEYYLPEDVAVTHIAFSQDGRWLVTSAKNGMIAVWDLDTQLQTIRILGQPTGFNFMALSPDGYRVAAGNAPDRTSVWDVGPTGGGEFLTISAHEGKVYDAIYNPAGTKIASTGEDGTLKIWDASTGKLLHDLPSEKDWFHFPAFSPDGEMVAAANNEGGITIWDTSTGRELLTAFGDSPNITAIAFSPNGSEIAGGGKGGIVNLWNVDSGQVLFTFETPDGISITELVFSADGDYIFSYDLLGTARVWNTKTGEQSMSLSANLSCEATVWDAALSSDGMLQALASFDGYAYIFKVTREPETPLQYVNLHNLAGHEGAVTGVAFDPEGSILASSGFDGSAKLWDLDTGVSLVTLTNQSLPLEGVDFSPDGRYVVTSGDDGKVNVYIVSLEELIEVARSRLSRDLTEEECQTYLHLPICEEDN